MNLGEASSHGVRASGERAMLDMADTGTGSTTRIRRWWTEEEDHVLRREADFQRTSPRRFGP